MADKNRSCDNRFVEAVATAQKEKWCVAPWCTTCGHQDFRAATTRIDDGTTNLTKELCDLPIAELTKYHGWVDCLRSVFERSHPITHKGMVTVLETWCNTPDTLESGAIRFCDVVLFYGVRRLILEPDLRRRWIEKCERMALATHDESLVESMIYVLGSAVRKHHGLFSLAEKLSANSTKIASALAKNRPADSKEF